ncbi:MAG: peptidoglycan DD-metalloendopeptidase family protein [Mariprofundus sp.]|nr:peptidoglycan DD-metalloendopeptidase family protein [Mariprofundus sp.]
MSIFVKNNPSKVMQRSSAGNFLRLALTWLTSLSRLQRVALAAVIIFTPFFILLSHGGDASNAYVSTPHEEWLAADIQQPSIATSSKHVVIKSGDHAISVLQKLGFNLKTARLMVSTATKRYNLKDIRAGKQFKRIDSATGTDVYYNVNSEQRLHLQKRRNEHQWSCTMDQRLLLTHQRVASGIIHNSLFAAAEGVGLDQRTTMNLVDLFSWDIDFARNMRRGDSFNVLYEEHIDDHGNLLNSTILAAEFVNRGEHYKAVRYEQLDGSSSYYTPKGKSIRKAYLKAPVKFSRISSRFTTRRLHPVLGYTRAHRGVDYAASSGTPIHALGDGVIRFAGWKHGYGRFILIKHNNRNHSTAYAHMRAFARGIKRGVRVKQGQVIGYVGMSGLATGPHLHFEFRVRGVAVNPLTVKHPPARPIIASQRDRFMQQTAPLLGQLQQKNILETWG